MDNDWTADLLSLNFPWIQIASRNIKVCFQDIVYVWLGFIVSFLLFWLFRLLFANQLAETNCILLEIFNILVLELKMSFDFFFHIALQQIQTVKTEFVRAMERPTSTTWLASIY